MICLERFKIRSLGASVVDSSSDHRVYFANPSSTAADPEVSERGVQGLWSATVIDTIY